MDHLTFEKFSLEINKILNFNYEDNLIIKRNRKDEELQKTIKNLIEEKNENTKSILIRNKRG